MKIDVKIMIELRKTKCSEVSDYDVYKWMLYLEMKSHESVILYEVTFIENLWR